MMRSDARENGKLRPDLLQALSDLRPSFIRWPGGSLHRPINGRKPLAPMLFAAIIAISSGGATQITSALEKMSFWASVKSLAQNL